MPFPIPGGGSSGETVVLDPTAEATGRTELDITNWINAEGVDWGDAQVTQYMAEAQVGSIPVDYTIPNRTVTIPLILKDISGTDFATIRQSIQAKAALFQREGGWVSRTTSVGTFYADVVSATLRYGGDWFQANRDFDTDAVLTLECSPDFYSASITLDDITETTLPELKSVLKLSASNATIKGDYPARVKIVVDEDQGQAQAGLIWGFRSRNYSSAATAALAYEAEALTAVSPAASTAVTGSSGGNAVQHASLATTWTPVLSTQIAASGHMTHTGSYRVWARVRSTSTTPPRVRLLWDVGDLIYPTPNDAWRIPGTNNFYIADLGQIRIDPAPSGTHRWQGLIQGIGDTGGENVQVDRVWFQPVDESSGTLSAPQTLDPGLVAYTAWDAFNHAAGDLNGKTLPTTGTWSGSTDFDATGVGTVTRNVISSALIRAGTGALTNMVTGVDLTLVPGVHEAGIIARYVDASNYLSAAVGAVGKYVIVKKVIAGSPTTLVFTASDGVTSGGSFRFDIVITAQGDWTVFVDERIAVRGSDSALATSGTLASGGYGLYHNSPSAPFLATFDNFTAWVPSPDAVLNASQSAELRWDGMIREDSSGTSFGPVSYVTGSLPRLPPSGIENRPAELFLKASRGDLDSMADSGIDDISARVTYWPSWLLVPGS